LTPHDAADWLNIFGNAIWIFFSAGALYAGFRYQFKELRKDIQNAREENAKEHIDMKADLLDHEHRIRVVEWRRPAREED
jgi:hypothetical protein